MQPAVNDRIFSTVYLGGGTPSILDTRSLYRIFEIVRSHFCLADGCEITIESNPHTLTVDKLHDLAALGVNRLSIGIQSLSDRLLTFLGRPHSADDAVRALQAARAAGFDNIGVDLIYGIPGQTTEEWQATVEGVLALNPEHISAYALSLDEGSQFYLDAASGKLDLPDDESVSDMYATVMRLCSSAGYLQYELANFCRPGRACLHNMNYWNRGEYLGLGPGAWSFQGSVRRQSVASVREYAERLASKRSLSVHEELLTREQEAAETVMLQLRTSRGIDLARYRSRFGAESFGRLLMNREALRPADLLTETGHRLTLTARGKILANEVIARLTA